jgi:hypothetical protein
MPAFTAESPEMRLSERPDRILVIIPNMRPGQARRVAEDAVRLARRRMPKLTGKGAKRMQPLYGKGFYGIFFGDSYIWFQENGIRPFTMNKLAGKVIPMWIDDPTGKERSKNPKAKVRTTASGKTQVLIFRRAAQKGQRKTVKRKNKVTGKMETSSVPMSYPGAPGRINSREMGRPFTRLGKLGGQIAKGNGGVRWRHPGLAPRKFMNSSLTEASGSHGIVLTRLYVCDSRWRSHF